VTEYDVLVAGAGQVGHSAAYALAKGGFGPRAVRRARCEPWSWRRLATSLAVAHSQRGAVRGRGRWRHRL